MGKSNEEAIKAIKTAMEAEKNGLTAYLKYARETKDETGKNMFIILARDEVEHWNVLEKQLENLFENSKWVKTNIELSEIQRIMPKVRNKEKRIKGESGIDQLDALKTALDMELKAKEFYLENAEKVKDAIAKEMFIKIAAMEDAHYEIIQAELDSIKGLGFWFGIPEFSLEIK